ncbi:MAG: ubiquinone biosynthesis accessory factor UbiJ [Gammaproteobacteria bacterium]
MAATGAKGPDPASIVRRLVSRAISRLLELDVDTAARLARLEGHTMLVRVSDSEWQLALCIEGGRLELGDAGQREPEVVITGRVSDFLALARARRRGETVGAGRIEISGDLAVAQDVQALLEMLEVDFDELLSSYVGDVAAHQIGTAVRGLGRAAGGGARRFEQDLADYLKHEIELLPQRDEVERQRDAIFTLADDVDRAAARVRRLAGPRRR